MHLFFIIFFAFSKHALYITSDLSIFNISFSKYLLKSPRYLHSDKSSSYSTNFASSKSKSKKTRLCSLYNTEQFPFSATTPWGIPFTELINSWVSLSYNSAVWSTVSESSFISTLSLFPWSCSFSLYKTTLPFWYIIEFISAIFIINTGPSILSGSLYLISSL